MSQTIRHGTDSPDAAVTPMMVQYLDIKAEHPDCLLFYRMGDFYEMFFDDAVKAAAALDITLTKRGKHKGDDIAMCGVPVHSHESYLERLISSGFRVAVCEQTENPAEAKKRGPKSVVNRAVVRVVTPGTLTEDTLLDARSHNYLAACAEAGGALGLAWMEISTGEFLTQSIPPGALGAALARIAPGEVLIADTLLERPDLYDVLGDWRDRLTPQPASRFDSVNGTRRLQELFGVKTLDAFGGFGREELAAAGALVDYVELTQKGRLPRIAPPKRLGATDLMGIDAATRRNLELTETLGGDRKGSLLSVIDMTLTGAGARLLASHLSAPLTTPVAIDERLDMVQFFMDGERLRGDVRDLLKRCPDMERALSRLSLDRGGPRDLAAIRDGLALAVELQAGFRDADGLGGPPLGIAACITGLGHPGDLLDRLGRALGEPLPVYARDGGFIAPGYATELDEFRRLRDESRRLIAALQSRYVDETGVASLKIKHNNVLGYFVEVSARLGDQVPTGADAPFIHRQTMANAVRFSTVELSEMETAIARAADQALGLELALFEDLRGEVMGRIDAIAGIARAMAGLDVASGLAALAAARRYVRPIIDDGHGLDIRGGRHPVVEAALNDRNEAAFIGNDCALGDAAGSGRLWLLTGPNMAGKSTFLRQNALIAVMVQMGSFVPADHARLGAVDRLFSRVGAADDLARGRSTFMVEMVETAAILNQAGPRSLVILDEIGRGTATFDGLSIAWAVIEHLHEANRCRGLFATHYHELTKLTARLDGLACHTMKVKEWQGEVIFLHEVGEGAADRSYGIHVGKLAGLPGAVVSRAEEILESLEQGDHSGAVSRLADDLPLFQVSVAAAAPTVSSGPSPLVQALGDVHPDELSPRDALEIIYRLKGLLADE